MNFIVYIIISLEIGFFIFFVAALLWKIKERIKESKTDKYNKIEK